MDLHLLTAVHVDLVDHFAETAASVAVVRAALADHGVRVAWHVVVDGEGDAVPGPVEATSYRALCANCGVSVARNLTLAATDGTGWSFRLDGDDTLDVDGWCALLRDPRFGATTWHPTNLIDHDGLPTAHWFDEERLWLPREVEERWTSPMPFHPNNVVVRSDLALAVGGWPALSVNEDLLWCFALNEHEPGLALAHVTLRYRKWDRQTVGAARYMADKAAAFGYIERVVNARRTRVGLAPIVAPQPGPGALYRSGDA